MLRRRLTQLAQCLASIASTHVILLELAGCMQMPIFKIHIPNTRLWKWGCFSLATVRRSFLFCVPLVPSCKIAMSKLFSQDAYDILHVQIYQYYQLFNCHSSVYFKFQSLYHRKDIFISMSEAEIAHEIPCQVTKKLSLCLDCCRQTACKACYQQRFVLQLYRLSLEV